MRLYQITVWIKTPESEWQCSPRNYLVMANNKYLAKCKILDKDKRYDRRRARAKEITFDTFGIQTHNDLGWSPAAVIRMAEGKRA